VLLLCLKLIWLFLTSPSIYTKRERFHCYLRLNAQGKEVDVIFQSPVSQTPTLSNPTLSRTETCLPWLIYSHVFLIGYLELLLSWTMFDFPNMSEITKVYSNILMPYFLVEGLVWLMLHSTNSRNTNFLLTEREGRTGEYWPEVVAVRTSLRSVRTKTTEGQYSSVRSRASEVSK